MSTDNTKRIIAHGGPVTAALKAPRKTPDAPWQSDGSDAQERLAALYEARRALADGFHDRAELLDLSTAAYRGPIELARRMRETAHGSNGYAQRRSLNAYLVWLFGDADGPHGQYASAFVYTFQAIRPFIRSVH